MTSRASSVCEEDNADDDVAVENETFVTSRGTENLDQDESADEAGYGQYGSDQAEANENRPLLPPARHDKNNGAMYAAINVDDADANKMSAEDDYTGDITASTSDSRAPWLAFCIKNFTTQVCPDRQWDICVTVLSCYMVNRSLISRFVYPFPPPPHTSPFRYGYVSFYSLSTS